jgi:hypothetical protein
MQKSSLMKRISLSRIFRCRAEACDSQGSLFPVSRGVKNLVRFEENDLFKADIQEASVLTLFLLNSVNLLLRPKLLQELKPGTRIVSNTFRMGDWMPDREETVAGTNEKTFLSRKLHLWTVPPRSGN